MKWHSAYTEKRFLCNKIYNLILIVSHGDLTCVLKDFSSNLHASQYLREQKS